MSLVSKNTKIIQECPMSGDDAGSSKIKKNAVEREKQTFNFTSCTAVTSFLVQMMQ